MEGFARRTLTTCDVFLPPREACDKRVSMSQGREHSIPPQPLSNAATARKRAARWRRVLVVIVVLLLVVYFTYTPIISAIIGGKLRDAVETRLNAPLRYDSLVYIFPYQVRIKGAHLMADRALGKVELITI